MQAMDQPPITDAYRARAVDDANAWVARFAPLLMDETVDEAEVRRRLKMVRELRYQGPAIRDRLNSVGGPEHQELAATLSSAYAGLDSVENDLRTRLGRMAPGDPDGIVDLEALQDRLAEHAARHEVGLPTEMAQPSRLELVTSPRNLAGAGFMGIFGIGWNTFTAIHATLFIGGFKQAIGWWALGFLAFYAIFFAVGFGMLAGALNSASVESIEIDGRELTVRRKMGGWTREKRYTLGPESRAEISTTATTSDDMQSAAATLRYQRFGQNPRTKTSVVITDENGSPVSLAAGATDLQRETIVKKVNAYLAAQ